MRAWTASMQGDLRIPSAWPCITSRMWKHTYPFFSFLVSCPGILGFTSDFHEEAAAGVSGGGLLRRENGQSKFLI